MTRRSISASRHVTENWKGNRFVNKRLVKPGKSRQLPTESNTSSLSRNYLSSVPKLVFFPINDENMHETLVDGNISHKQYCNILAFVGHCFNHSLAKLELI